MCLIASSSSILCLSTVFSLRTSSFLRADTSLSRSASCHFNCATSDSCFCSKCSRVNSSDARFCDWCGSKPQPYQSPLICSQCQASNSAFARFCNTCGCGIEPPPRVSRQSPGNVIGTVVEKRSIRETVGRSENATWLPVSIPSTPAEKADKGKNNFSSEIRCSC